MSGQTPCVSAEFQNSLHQVLGQPNSHVGSGHPFSQEDVPQPICGPAAAKLSSPALPDRCEGPGRNSQ